MELTIVCLLTALILTISIPTLRSSIYTDELDSTTRKIVGTIQELRNMAQRESKEYFLHIGIDDNKIWHEDVGASQLFGREKKNLLELPEDVVIEDIQTTTQGKITSDTAVIWINSKGNMDQTMLHLQESDRKRSLFFTPFSSTPRIYDEYIDLEDK